MTDPLAKTAAAAATVTAVTVDASPEILGVQAGVLLAACAGALFSLAYSPPEAWRELMALPAGSAVKRATAFALRGLAMAFTLVVNAFVAAWVVSSLPHFPGFGWSGSIPPVPAAGLLAFAGQHVIPHGLGFLKQWMQSRGKA